MTVWFPLRLRSVILKVLPTVDNYTELGNPRTASDMDREYQRIIDRDRQPLVFLFKGFFLPFIFRIIIKSAHLKDYRRGWGTYKSFFLFAKLSALVIIAFLSPDNCIFRSLPRSAVSIMRQSVLVSAMIVFFVLQCIWTPFIDPVNNASEWISRLNYLSTALIGLAVAANIPGEKIIDGPILYM